MKAFVGAGDVPGENKITLGGSETEIFAFDKIRYQEQPIGIIVASSPEIAQKAASLVKVKYSPAKVLHQSLQLRRVPSLVQEIQ